MQWYHYVMAGAAILAGLAAFKRPRALLWIGLLAASYIISVGYLHGYEAIEASNILAVYSADPSGYVPLARDWLPPATVGAMCDIPVALVIRYGGREKWEVKWLAGAVFVMAASNIVYSGYLVWFPPAPEQWILGIALELINIFALLLIVTGGTRIVDWISERVGHRRGHRGVFGRSLTYLRTPAKAPLWHR